MKQHFRGPKQRVALRKLISPPPEKGFLRLWNKKICSEDIQEYIDICFPISSKMQFLSVWKWCSANVFFLTPTKNMFVGKFVKGVRLLAALWENVFYNV